MVRYKKKQSTLRDKFPSHSYTGDPTLSDKGFELLKVEYLDGSVLDGSCKAVHAGPGC